MANILVTGGTGRLGRELLPRLVAAGHEVRALVRRPGAVLPDGIEAVSGDLGAASLGQPLASAAFEGVDLAGTRVQLTPCARQVVRMSCTSRSWASISTFPLYRAKVEIKAMLATSGLPWTSLRTTQFHELIWDVFDQPLPAPFLPQGMRYQPLAAAEVATVVVDLLKQPPANGIIEMGGPEILESAELASIFTEVTGRSEPALRPAPTSTATLDALVTPNHREGRQPWSASLEAQRRAGTL